MAQMGGDSAMRSARIEWDIEKLRQLVRDEMAKGQYGSIQTIALAAGIRPTELLAILVGRKNMRPDTARQIASFFGIDVSDLVKDK
jgi:plasmid maintenance system antidote protein VapI